MSAAGSDPKGVITIGEAYLWIEQEAVVCLKAVDRGDPVELTSKQARELAGALLKCADELDRLDSDAEGLDESGHTS